MTGESLAAVVRRRGVKRCRMARDRARSAAATARFLPAPAEGAPGEVFRVVCAHFSLGGAGGAQKGVEGAGFAWWHRHC